VVPAWGGAGLGWCRPGVVPAYYLLLEILTNRVVMYIATHGAFQATKGHMTSRRSDQPTGNIALIDRVNV